MQIEKAESRPGIYAIKVLRTGEFYIGRSKNVRSRLLSHAQRLRTGVHHNRKMQDEWSSGGSSAFYGSAILYCSHEDTVMYEQLLLDQLNPPLNVSTNAKGGGPQFTPEQKAKISEGVRLSWIGASERRAKQSEESRRRIISEEARARISAAQIGRPMPLEVRAKISAYHKGRPKSPEAIAKTAAANRGIKRSPEFCERVRLAKLNQSDESRKRLRDAQRARDKSTYARSLSDDDVRAIFVLRKAGKSHREISEVFGMGRTAITKVLSRETYRHVELKQ